VADRPDDGPLLAPAHVGAQADALDPATDVLDVGVRRPGLEYDDHLASLLDQLSELTPVIGHPRSPPGPLRAGTASGATTEKGPRAAVRPWPLLFPLSLAHGAGGQTGAKVVAR